MRHLKSYLLGVVFATALLFCASVVSVVRQRAADSIDAHVAAAKAAAGTEHTAVFNDLCAAPAPRPAAVPPAGAAAPPAGPPSRAQYHADPAKVFDNLYYLGQTEYSAWAVTTSEGIIVVDALFDYSVDDEIVNGLMKL